MHVQYLNTLLCPQTFTLLPQMISPKRHFDATKYPESAIYLRVIREDLFFGLH